MVKITVVVTGVGGGGVGEGIVKALKLNPRRYKIISTDMNVLSAPLFRSDKGYVIPSASKEEYILNLFSICKKEKAQVLIPGSVPELERISKEREIFEENNIISILSPKDVVEIGLDKWKTYNFLRENKFLCPRTYLAEDVHHHLDEINFPLLVKPRRGFGSREVHVTYNLEELNFFVQYLKRRGYDPLVLEYIDPEGREYTVGVVVSRDGKIMGSISIQREIKSGFSYRMIVDDFYEVRKNAEAIAQKIGAIGPINIQCFLTDEGPITFEINPRFSGTTPIRSVCGFNEVDATIRNFLFGEEVKLDFKKGIAVVRYLNEVYVDSWILDELKLQGFVVGGGQLKKYM